jgi:hypothetical protein
MASFNKCNPFVEDVMEGVHDLGSDTLKIMLSNTALNATFADTSDVTEITAENGYSAGGSTVTITASAQSGGTYKLEGNDLVFTASGGTVGPFQYAVLYNDSAASDQLIGWWDYGSAVTLQDTETFTVDFTEANGILQLA